jgi:hypothetical protein
MNAPIDLTSQCRPAKLFDMQPSDWPCFVGTNGACPTCGTTGDCRLPPPGAVREAWLQGRRYALADARRDA